MAPAFLTNMAGLVREQGRQGIMADRLCCRGCGATQGCRLLDLGVQPPSNRLLTADQLSQPEPVSPLRLWLCQACWLVQVEAVQAPADLFPSDYPYFSGYAETWRRHVRDYGAAMIARLGLGAGSLVVEVASNDGTLLQPFHQQGIPVLGIEPAAGVAAVAVAERGIPTVVRFFGAALAAELAAEHGQADLIVANNVLAHVPDLNDFVAGLGRLLKPMGTLTLEFPHLLRTLEGNQFDTIYHEHYSYLSLGTAGRMLAAHGLAVCDVEELPTHGGSLRLHVAHTDAGRAPSVALDRIAAEEQAAGLDRLEGYQSFSDRAHQLRQQLLEFLTTARAAGQRVIGYGAPAKGNTLLNFCGIGPELLAFTVDRSPHKQGKFLPGSHLPVRAPAALLAARPDFVLILPWNLQDEVIDQMGAIRDWGGRFVVPIPALRVLP
jgi:SAM-dependent methyltransferase